MLYIEKVKYRPDYLKLPYTLEPSVRRILVLALTATVPV
jgi:hypothetical protein